MNNNFSPIKEEMSHIVVQEDDDKDLLDDVKVRRRLDDGLGVE